jgi:ABC-type glycerol-3-phosphate transport system permease component
MYQTSWNLVCAGALIAAVAPVAVFFTLQRELIAGLTTVQPSEV